MREPFKDYPDDAQEHGKAADADTTTLAVHLAMLLTGDAPGKRYPDMPLPAVINAIMQVYAGPGRSPSVVLDHIQSYAKLVRDARMRLRQDPPPLKL